MADGVLTVMVSSNFQELQRERATARDAIQGQRMLALMMETDSAIPDRGIIQNSRKMVTEADVYVVLISNYRYGSIVEDPQENPKQYSTTELEFDHAEKLGRPICAYLMDDGVNPGVPVAQIQAEAATAHRLREFRKRAQHHSRISATFTSVDDLKAKVTKTLGDLKADRTAAKQPDGERREAAAAGTLPAPPAFVAHPPYVPGHPFQGRARELGLMRDWATSPANPVLVFEAIGGMGKSTVTWEWVTNHAAADRSDWAGRLWYSFYERGADMRDFKVTALAYITHQPPETFRARPDAALTQDLLQHLTRAPFLLVLDGLERVLAAYHRADAAQLRDEDVREDGDTGMIGRQPQDCIRPDDHDLLLHLASAGPSKLLVSSRLMPRALLNAGGEPVPGVRHEHLHGLAPEDAEAMLRRAGINGDGERMRRYLAQAFDCHPLVVGFAAGLVRNAPWARMGFDRWVDDARGGASVNRADADLRQRQTHILKLAFDALEPRAHELLARLGMLANAVGYDVVEALNPARPDPPKELPQPTPADVGRDLELTRLQRQRAGAKAEPARADLERRITERRASLERRAEAARAAHAEYQAALEAWRRSPALRDAGRWLDATLANLEARGLLQWDRPTETFDLHPVVRGYAIGALDPEARGQAGQRVADIFSARAEPDYEQAQSPRELADRIQMAQALTLAGNLQQPWNVLWPGTLKALYRLETHHETLALLRPMFPDGWLSPPSGVDDAGDVASVAVVALRAIGRRREEEAQKVFAIQDDVAKGLSTNLSILLHNHYHTLRDGNEPAGAAHVLALARDVAVALDEQQRVLWGDVSLVLDRTEQGQVGEARSLWTDMVSRPAWQHRDGQLEAQCLLAEGWRLHREAALTAAFLDAAFARVRALGERSFERWLWQLAGDWHQSAGRDTEAADAFAHAIRMAREVGLSDTDSEAQRGLSLARLGRRREADSAAASAERAPPHVYLAELYLALEQREQARTHALAGYKWAWADGPPWYHHWQLQRCRAVLQALGEPEPQLSPFDPAKVKPIDYEPDIRRLLAEHTAKNKR
jgi:hypothetical protein